MSKITSRNVLTIPKHTILWDSAVKGFHVRRQYGDAITFAVFYRNSENRQRRHKIGRYGVWTPDQARKEAQRILRAKDLGEDPTAERMALRQSITMEQLCDEYVSDMQSGKISGKKASTIKSDISRIATHIKPKLGKRKVTGVTPDDVETFMRSFNQGSARRVGALARSGQETMPESFENTTLFKRFKAQPSLPDPLADKVQAQAAFDEVLSELGVRAPPPEAKESEAQYLGPEERKGVNRYNAALAEFVRGDLEIARQEAHTPHYTLKEGILTERHIEDASGRSITKFYSKSGPSIWMDTFKDPVMRYVSGGSNGILDPDKPRPPVHNFIKTRTTPELIEMRRLEAYHDSAEYKITEAYKAVGLPPPDMKKVLSR
jgi:Arm DNA-binding domain